MKVLLDFVQSYKIEFDAGSKRKFFSYNYASSFVKWPPAHTLIYKAGWFAKAEVRVTLLPVYEV